MVRTLLTLYLFEEKKTLTMTVLLIAIPIVLFFAEMKKPKTGLKKASFSLGGLLLIFGAFCAVFGGFLPLPNGLYVILASSIPLLVSALVKNPATGEG